ncbi:MAG: SDR family NAD(P)-dependent oxidoreductase [Hyphomicrobiales bacterium]|nr:SDR family NAD(P)-dependent oxidoreductase [Hyphomicrobiales bacterium]
MSPAPKRIVILGAASAIAEAAARLWAGGGARFALFGRNASRLEAIAADLRARGASAAEVVVKDCATADAAAEIDLIADRLGGLDVVLLAYGVLWDQAELERDPEAAAELMKTNLVSAAAWCLAAANHLERQRSGALVVIGSVAGDRGRGSNYVYGASKAGLAVLVEGIAHRLAKSNARAILVKPGFVDTPMTAHVPKKGLLWARPDAVGQVVVRAAERGGPVVYAPFFWRPIMTLVRAVPSPIFHRTNL